MMGHLRLQPQGPTIVDAAFTIKGSVCICVCNLFCFTVMELESQCGDFLGNYHQWPV